MSINLTEITTVLRIIRKTMSAEALHKLLDHIDAEKQQGIPIPQLPGIETAEELMADAGNLPPMLVDGLLPDHSLFLLTGKPKAGKSFLALDIADSISRGLPVLGQLKVNRPGPVLYLAMEDGKRELARRLAQRGHESPTTNNQQPTASNLYFISEPFSLTEPLNYARFRELARSLPARTPITNATSPTSDHPNTRIPEYPTPYTLHPKPYLPSLIVIDTAAEALDIRDWINRAEILTKIAPIRRLAREICTVLLVAHNRKAEGDMGDEIAGSNALAGAIDGWISAHKVERRENGNRRLFLRVEGRGGVGHELVTEMDHTTLRFSLITTEQVESDEASVRQTVHVARRQERRARAHHALHELGDRATIAELAAAMGVAYSVAWSVVREMTALFEIEEIAATQEGEGSGRRAPTYRLRQPPNIYVS